MLRLPQPRRIRCGSPPGQFARSPGEMAVFCYGLEPPWLTWSIVGPDGTVRRGPTVVAGVDEPMMVHDMALTSRFLVLVLAPAIFDLPAAVSGGSFIAWRPERGTRVALVPRDGGPVRWAADEAFWLWHTVHAYDSSGRPSESDRPDPTVTLDYVQWPRLALGDSETSRSGRVADSGARTDLGQCRWDCTDAGCRRRSDGTHGAELS